MSNNQKPKNPADLLSGLMGIVNMLDAIKAGGQITPEMIAQAEKVNGTCPPEVLKSIETLNFLNKNHPEANPFLSGKVPPTPDTTMVEKVKANLMSNEAEDKEVENCVEQFLKMWGDDKELSEKFPLKVAGSILYILGTARTNDGGEYQKNVLRILDTTREYITEDMLRKQTGASCH